MTREEAIYRLKNMAWLYGSAEREQNIEAIDMAIEALKREARFLKDFEDNTPTDLISRADAIEAVQDVDTRVLISCDEVVKALKALPSADRPSEERLLQEIKHLREQNNQLSELYTALSVNTKGDNE